MQSNKYVPGVCNIGRYEIEKRRRYAIFYIFIALLFPYASYYIGFPGAIKLIVFLPAFLAATNILQIYYKFCIYFGLSSYFNFSDKDITHSVISEESRKLDYQKAYKMLFIALGFSSIYTIIVVALF